MEQILTRNGNKVDAVVASNDGTAGGVVAALSARGISGVPVSGQDGDQAALNRVALGTQTVSVWKDARDLGREAADAAVDLAGGKPVPGTIKWTGGDHKVTLDSKFLKPVADHQRQPRRRRQGRLDQQGQPVPRRGRGQGPGRLQVRRPRARARDARGTAPSLPANRLMESLQLSALDLRLGLMACVLAVMAATFHVLTGNFLTPENLYNIAQQTAVVGIVATAISLVIVARHIDLSVGSVIGFVGVLIAYLQYTAGWHWAGPAWPASPRRCWPACTRAG